MITVLNKYKQNCILYILIGIIASFFLYIFIPHFVSKSNLICRTYEANLLEDNELLILNDDTILKQKVESPYQYIKEIAVRCSTDEGIVDGLLMLELWDDTVRERIRYIEKEMILIKNDDYVEFSFPTAVLLDSTHLYSFRVSTDYTKKSNKIGIYVTQDSIGQQEEFYINNELSTKGLNFKITGYNDGYSNKTIFLFLLSLFFVLTGLICYRVVQNDRYDTLNWLDWIFVLAAIFSCMLFFNQGFDMQLTILHSKDLLSTIKNGNFMNFYSVVLNKALHGQYLGNGVKDAAYYNIFLYLIMGIWILPCRLIEKFSAIEFSDRFYVLYFNLFVMLLVIYSVYLVYKLATDMKIEKEKAKLICYFYASSVIMVFSTVGFCQMDIIYIILVLIAMRGYIQKKYLQFAGLMSVAIMLKMFPVLIFIPLILLVEKRLLHILKYCIIGLSSSAVFAILFNRDAGYRYTKKEMGAIYDFAGRIFRNRLEVGIGACAFFVFIMVILCIWCFDHDIQIEERWKYIVSVPLVAYGSFIIFLWWHPEWLIMLMPFIALAVVLNPNNRSLIYCEWGMGLLFWMVAAQYFPYNVDNYMVNWGILPEITGTEYSGITIADILAKISNADIALTSLLVGLIVYFCYNSVRSTIKKKDVNMQEQDSLHRGLVLVRIVSVYMLCLLYVGMYFYLG